jgi:hypothetical protein
VAWLMRGAGTGWLSRGKGKDGYHKGWLSCERRRWGGGDS